VFRLYGKLPDRKDLLDRKLKVCSSHFTAVGNSKPTWHDERSDKSDKSAHFTFTTRFCLFIFMSQANAGLNERNARRRRPRFRPSSAAALPFIMYLTVC
jgi:hypothetical protein